MSAGWVPANYEGMETMPLDPQAEALLGSMKDAGAKPFETMTPAEARVAAWAFKDLGGPPEEVGESSSSVCSWAHR